LLQAPVADVLYGMFVPSKGLVTDAEMIMLACGILGATVMCVAPGVVSTSPLVDSPSAHAVPAE